jgi:hypothetical protein
MAHCESPGGSEMNARKIKRLGLALTAVLAMSLMAAPASEATQGSFTWANTTVKLDVTQHPRSVGEFRFDAGNIQCNEVHMDASVSGTGSSEFSTTNGTYQNSGSADTCPASIGTATVGMNGCFYTFTAGETLNAMETTGSIHIVCPSEKVFSVSVAGLCTIEIGSHTPTGGHVIYRTITNSGGANIHDVTVEFTISAITYDQTGIFCPNGGTKHASNGTYNGRVTIIGTNASGGQTSVEVS